MREGWAFTLWFVRKRGRGLWHVDNPDVVQYVTMCGWKYDANGLGTPKYDKRQQPSEGAPLCEVCKGMLTRYILRYGLPQQEQTDA